MNSLHFLIILFGAKRVVATQQYGLEQIIRVAVQSAVTTRVPKIIATTGSALPFLPVPLKGSITAPHKLFMNGSIEVLMLVYSCQTEANRLLAT